jgi:hypothetical protein
MQLISLRGGHIWRTPMREQLERIPKLYETEHISAEEKIIYLHFFFGRCDWFISEYDGEDIFLDSLSSKMIMNRLNGNLINRISKYISY